MFKLKVSQRKICVCNVRDDNKTFHFRVLKIRDGKCGAVFSKRYVEKKLRCLVIALELMQNKNNFIINSSEEQFMNFLFFN